MLAKEYHVNMRGGLQNIDVTATDSSPRFSRLSVNSGDIKKMSLGFPTTFFMLRLFGLIPGRRDVVHS